MEPINTRPFHFPATSNPGKQTPLTTTTDEDYFFSEFFDRGLQIVRLINHQFSESYYTLFRGAIDLLIAREEELNRRYQREFKEIAEGFSRKLDPKDPLLMGKVKVRLLWAAQRFADEEAGRQTEVSLYEQKGHLTFFTSLRHIHYIVEKEATTEQRKVLELPGTLKLSETDVMLLKEEQHQTLRQMDNTSLRVAYMERLKKGLAVQNNIPPEKILAPPVNNEKLIRSEMIGELSCLVFRTLEQATDRELANKTDLKLACKVAEVYFSVEEIELLFFYNSPVKRRGSSRVALSEEIYKGIQEWMKRFSEPTAKPEEPSAGDKAAAFFKNIFLSNSDKNIANTPSLAKKPVKRPIFSKQVGGAWGHFYRKWIDLINCFAALKELLIDKKKKLSTPQIDFTSTEGQKPQRESSSFIQRKSPRNPKKSAMSDLALLLEQLLILMGTVSKELEPLAPIPQPLIPRQSTPMPVLYFDMTHPKVKPFLLKLYELVGYYEALILALLNHFDQDKPSSIWIYFVQHLTEIEGKENAKIVKDLNRAVRKFEEQNQDLKVSDPEKYSDNWARIHFKTQLSLGKEHHPCGSGRYTLPLMQDDLITPISDRYFIRLLNVKDGKNQPMQTVAELINAVKDLTLEQMIKIHGGHGVIRQLSHSPEANVIDRMMKWFSVAQREIRKQKGLNQSIGETLEKKLKKLTPSEFDVLLIEGLTDSFFLVQSLKTNPIFLEEIKVGFSQMRSHNISELLSRLEALHKEFKGEVKNAKKLGPRVTNYSEVDLRNYRQGAQMEVSQLISNNDQLAILLKVVNDRSPRSPKEKTKEKSKDAVKPKKISEGCLACAELIATISNALFQVPLPRGASLSFS